MGRYYSGDIEGKFWFSVQCSNAADRFGVEGQEPNYLEYYFEQEDLPKVEKELSNIALNLGPKLERLDKFFDEHKYYNDKELADYFNMDVRDVNYMLSEYADYILGCEIRDCIRKNGECRFEAEL